MPTPAPARSRANAAAAAACDGGPAWDPVKTAMRIGSGGTRPSAAVVTEDPFGDADRLGAALTLDGHDEGELQAAGDLLDVLERDRGADLRADRHRRREAHLVQAVVHAHGHVGD